MRVVCVIPWRPTEARLPGYEYVTAWWGDYFPAVDVLTVDTDHVPYNLAAARNEAVRLAETLGADVVVISDADAVPASPLNVETAIQWAARTGGLHLPFTEQRYLDEAETEDLLRWGVPPPSSGSFGNGAMYAVTPEGWWAFGGQDERFSGWGGDDDQLVACASTLTSLTRHPGVLWSLWHADERRPVGTEEHRPNAELAARYGHAAGNPAAIRRLIAERSSLTDA